MLATGFDEHSERFIDRIQVLSLSLLEDKAAAKAVIETFKKEINKREYKKEVSAMLAVGVVILFFVIKTILKYYAKHG